MTINKTTPMFDEAQFRKFVPPEMLKEKRWVRYFLKPKAEGGTAKIPLGSHSDASTWDTFDNCVAKLENDQQGLGYCFLGGAIQALDVDHCRNPKTGQEVPISPRRVLVFRASHALKHQINDGHARSGPGASVTVTTAARTAAGRTAPA